MTDRSKSQPNKRPAAKRPAAKRPAEKRPAAARPAKKPVADHRHAAHTLRALAEATGPRHAGRFVDASALGLEPLSPLDLSACGSFSDLLTQMRGTAFAGRQLGEAADILEAMARDPDCLVIGTFSGAMTVAKQGLVICDMIDHGLIDVVVSTGALMAHGLVEASGMTHFKVSAEMSDREMYYAGFDRIYDTLELEQNLDDVSEVIDRLLDDWPADEPVGSRELHEMIGRHLVATTKGRGILRSAVLRDVPVYVPAFTDSELGLDVALHNRRRRARNDKPIQYDAFMDLEDFTRRIAEAKRIGIFTIGGGVPRNWAQQACPYLDLIASRIGKGIGPQQRYHYGVRICPEPVHWGGLSGCTYSEGVSWGKFVPPSEGGRFAEVLADATVAWPLLVAGVLERLGVERA